MRIRFLLFVLTCVASSGAARGAGQVAHESAGELLRSVDARQRNVGDWRSVVYLEQRQRGKDELVYETISMRRSATRQFLMLFTKPKSVAGQGYLVLDRNLWFYDPSVGKWERRTERERIGGTGSRRTDFDEWHFAEEYDPVDGGQQLVGKHPTRLLILNAKPDLDVAFPVVHLWVDEDNKTVLKRQDFALSGRLLRTTYYPKWQKVYSPSKKADVWYPKEIRLYDELEAGTWTLLLVQSVDAGTLEANVFTKAWLEGKSR